MICNYCGREHVLWEKRKSISAALLIESQGRWATLEEIESSLEQPIDNLSSVLKGMTLLGDLNEKEENGKKFYQLDKIGVRRAGLNMLIQGGI